MKISIAVASLNYGQYIGACLGSILSQDYSDYEILIADGGSNDDSLAIINNYCNSDNRFKLVSTRDNGQADAISKALSSATGDIIGFLNADDCYICDDVFSEVVKSFGNYKSADLITFAGCYIDDKGKMIRQINQRIHPLDAMSWMKYRPQIIQPATFWRRSVTEVIPFQTHFHYVFDAVFFYKAYLEFSILELAKPVVGYRLHGENKSMNVRSDRITELARFEQLKFGRYSLRAIYLHIVSWNVTIFGSIPLIGNLLKRLIYLMVNALAFISFYRLPGI